MRHITLTFIILLSALESTVLQATPRNVILIIGDSYDDQHVTMGRNYLSGMSGQLGLDTLAFRASVQIETVNDKGQPLYVADSANTATSLATGGMTNIGRIATDIADNDLPSIAERAIEAGWRSRTRHNLFSHRRNARLISCSRLIAELRRPQEVLGSTYYGIPQPACLSDARDNGGPGSIVEQLVGSGAHVLCL